MEGVDSSRSALEGVHQNEQCSFEAHEKRSMHESDVSEPSESEPNVSKSSKGTCDVSMSSGSKSDANKSSEGESNVKEPSRSECDVNSTNEREQEQTNPITENNVDERERE